MLKSEHRLKRQAVNTTGGANKTQKYGRRGHALLGGTPPHAKNDSETQRFSVPVKSDKWNAGNRTGGTTSYP